MRTFESLPGDINKAPISSVVQGSKPPAVTNIGIRPLIQQCAHALSS